ncbi:MAG: hypothetical protein HQK55_12040 [Deltaproteobacteria bacterium]|nr:hypothetical protein [Deltaproteobacteria bacterium]
MSDRNDWVALAKELGLEFKPGIDDLLESPSLQKMVAPELGIKDLSQAMKMLANPMVHSLLSKIFLGAATGFYQDLEFILYRGSSTSTRSFGQQTRYAVHINVLFHKNQDMGLDMKAAWWGAKFGKAIMPNRYLPIPTNPELDKLVVVKTADASRTKLLLERSDLATALLKMYQYSPKFHVTDHGIRYKESGRIIAADRARIIMDLLAEAAEKFGR